MKNKKIFLGIGILILILLLASITYAGWWENTQKGIGNAVGSITNQGGKTSSTGPQIFQTINAQYTSIAKTIDDANKINPPTQEGADYTTFYQQKSKKLEEIITKTYTLDDLMVLRKGLETYSKIYSENQKVREETNNALQEVKAFMSDDPKDGKNDGKIGNTKYSDTKLNKPASITLKGDETIPDEIKNQEKIASGEVNIVSEVASKVTNGLGELVFGKEKMQQAKQGLQILDFFKQNMRTILIIIGIIILLGWWGKNQTKKSAPDTKENSNKIKEVQEISKGMMQKGADLMTHIRAFLKALTTEVKTQKDLNWWDLTRIQLIERIKIYKSYIKKLRGKTPEGPVELRPKDLTEESLLEFEDRVNTHIERGELSSEQGNALLDHFFGRYDRRSKILDRLKKGEVQEKPTEPSKIILAAGTGRRIEQEKPKNRYENLDKPKRKYDNLK